MATAEVLRLTHSVEDKVEGVNKGVQGVDGKVEGVDKRVRRVDHKVRTIDDRLRHDLRNWLSPPDPSINYNTACGTHHEGTAAWLTRGDAFKGWRADGCLLWVHGKPGSGKSIL
ncbi:hypothetical protein EDB92DRAFT_1883972, partial [Lactarius akahatsu]